MPPGPPLPDEFAPYYAGYVARVSGVSSPIDELSAQRARFLALLSPLTEAGALYRYAPGKWSIKELVGHLADAERIFSYRMLRIGRGDTTPLAGFEENAYVRAAASDDRPLADLLEDWSAARASTLALARGMPPEAWTRRGTASDASVTSRAVLYIILGHVEHHRGVLGERYGLR